MKIIAKIHTDFRGRFGIPRQSGLTDGVGRIVFEPEFRDPNALRGIEGYSHLWIIWEFSELRRDGWRPTVRPPRLGGNTRVGVFATRSPYRPNPIGLSSVRLISVEHTESEGDVLVVSGADMLDGTPIYDIKPYLPFTDAHPEATSGFAGERLSYRLNVIIPEPLAASLSPAELVPVKALLEGDPRPSYQDDPEREYGFFYSDAEIKFRVSGDTLTVTDITRKRLL